ncbi:MAG: OmpA family protein [Flavobacteriaceae bacterium]|nr:OmpA family protein [Flavobacteriaceae bacterium]
MKNFLFAFIVFLLYSVFGMWYYSCIVKGLCGNNGESNVSIEASPTNAGEVQTIESGNTTDIIQRNNTATVDSPINKSILDFTSSIGISNKEGSISLPDNAEQLKGDIFNYLNNNQDMELIITGFHNKDETSTIAIERANEIKAILEDFGINEDKLLVDFSKRQYQYDTNGSYKGGIELKLRKLSAERLSEIESGIANKTLYSGFASKQFRADNTLQAYAIELKSYLEKYSDKSASITGHTDSVGDNIANDWFGMERAKNVRKYLISQGIDPNRLAAYTKGEKEPIDTNGTLEGRRKNRRIEIKVN